MVSVATSLIPFLEHDDANRALMGANMQRQAVPLLRSESPLVGTGMEGYAAIDAGDVITADKAGVVLEVSADVVTIQLDEGGTQEYFLRKFDRSNQGTSYNNRVIVDAGDRIEVGQVLADGPATENGELALGKNLLVAFMPWEGHNFEDAIILSQNLVKDDVLSSIHIEEYEVDAATPSSARRRSPGPAPTSAPSCSPTSTSAASSGSAPRSPRRHPGRQGHAEGRDRAVGRGAPAARDLQREEPRGARHLAQGSHGEEGTIIGVKVFDCAGRRRRARLGVNQRVSCLHRPEAQDHRGRQARRRHGNKGVISKILPVEDMPFLADGPGRQSS
jgi:DNA-directed RNA polymerase subunit beta (EC 2.7.7.6)